MAKREAPPDEGSKTDPNAWMATFSDLLTLMLTFFVLLLTMSSMDNSALKETFGFFSDRMGILRKAASAEIKNASPVPVHNFISGQVFTELSGLLSEREGEAARLAILLENMIDENNLEHLLQAKAVPGGIVISIASDVLFAPDGETLLPEGKLVLKSIADLINQNNHTHLRVDGIQHDDVGDRSAWDVATDRSLAVVGYLVTTSRIDPRQLAVGGYGKGFSGHGLPGKSNKIELMLTWFEKPIRP